MKSIDTNILVRFLTGDDVKQAKAALSLFKEAESNGEPLYVSCIVVFELIWVLESSYDSTREEVLTALDECLMLACLEFENAPAIHRLVREARSCKQDLSDLLIGIQANSKHASPTITLDKLASRHPLFQRLV